jgi:hypothetical protein
MVGGCRACAVGQEGRPNRLEAGSTTSQLPGFGLASAYFRSQPAGRRGPVTK